MQAAAASVAESAHHCTTGETKLLGGGNMSFVVMLGLLSVQPAASGAPVSSAPPVAAVEALQKTATKPGKIVMFRPALFVGAALACPIRYKGQEIVELGRGKFAEWQVPAGRYILTNKTSSVELNVEAGETRYVRCIMKTGFLTGRADLQIVDEESFGDGAQRWERKEITLSKPL